MPQDRNGRVLWITGLSGAGKSTIARDVAADLAARGAPVIRLDGDELRDVLGMTQAMDRASRLNLSMTYARLCKMLAEQGYTVVIATISLFAEVHAWNRENLPLYTEIYLKVPLDELKRRDPKQLYARATAGEVDNIAGLDFAVDEPKNADLVIENFGATTARTAVQSILKHIKGA